MMLLVELMVDALLSVLEVEVKDRRRVVSAVAGRLIAPEAITAR